MFNILEISRMTTHNGPGYRTNVHFMGCPLSCIWCSTPESQRYSGLGFNDQRCIGCRACADVCPTKAISFSDSGLAVLDRSKCTECYQCAEQCYAGALWKYGSLMTLPELLDEVTRDMPFFVKSGGGVNFSGGECLMNVDDEMESLYKALYEKGISIGVDTSGHVDWGNIEKVLPYVDFFLWDIKLLDSEKHKQYTGAGNELIKSNLERLTAEYETDVYIRYPLIPDINDSDQDIKLLCEYLNGLGKFRELHFLPYHSLGINRYRSCGREYLMAGARRQSPERLREILEISQTAGIACRIVG